MRRLFAIVAALGLLGSTFGCHHTAGVCDCDPGPHGPDGAVLAGSPHGPLQPVPAEAANGWEWLSAPHASK
jgi:hypothetical protein